MRTAINFTVFAFPLVIVVVACLLTAGSCKATEKQLRYSFYYWKVKIAPHPDEMAVCHSLDVKRVYIRAFDVTCSEEGICTPVSACQFDSLAIVWLNSLDIVPVVYISNSALYHISELQAEELAIKIIDKVERQFQWRPFHELQMDCDWTEKTRPVFFRVLETIRKVRPQRILSATIRLHQIKYRRQTGIPPVDKGMLMVYNLNNPTVFREQNSIYDNREALLYLKGQQLYDIPLDIALPLFSWGVHFRAGKFLGFWPGLDRNTADHLPFLQKGSHSVYQVIRDTVVNGTYFRNGEIVKLEDVSLNDLKNALDNVIPVIPNDTLQLTYFHLDYNILKHWSHEHLRLSHK